MDTAKQAPLCIFNFPPDIWACVAFYLSGEELGRLKMTGTRSVGRKMMITGVVKSIQLGKDIFQFKSWPSLLNEFPTLEELSIHRKTGNWWSLFNFKLNSVPSTVRKLQFDGEIEEKSVLFVGEGDRTLNLAEHLPRLECLDLTYCSIDDYSWLAYSPRSLTKLSIDAWDGTVALPSSLTVLKVNTMNFEDKPEGVTLPQLETLIAHRVNPLEFLVPLLPTSLRRLSCFRMKNPISDEVIGQFPRGLTCLKFDCEPHKLSERAIISLLPQFLTKLVVSWVLPSSKWSDLPSTLQYLSFKPRWPSGIVDAYPFQVLPRSITHLDIDSMFEKCFCAPPLESCDSYFPPQLTYLCIPGVQLAPEAAKQLPSSLTFLRLDNLSERVCEYFPEGLTILHSSRTLLTPNLFKFLPKSLTSLYMASVAEVYQWFDGEAGETISSVLKLAEFPIHANYSKFEWKDLSLPPRLTDLNLYCFYGLGDSFIVNQRLTNLLELKLEKSKYFTDLSIPLLSRHLTSIQLSSSSEISGKCFPYLPRGLTSLDLKSSPLILDSDIQHLPRTLKVLGLESARTLTNICIPDLPPHLETLFLNENDKITPDSYPSFPSLLRSSMYGSYVSFAKWKIMNGVINIL